MIDVDYMMENSWIIGTPDQVEEKIRALYNQVGGFGTLIVMSHDWEPYDKWLRSMTLLAKEVMPRLSDLTPPMDSSVC